MEHAKLIRVKPLLENLGISKATLYRYVTCGFFPKPVKLGVGSKAAVAWVTSEVDAWIAVRQSERDACLASSLNLEEGA